MEQNPVTRKQLLGGGALAGALVVFTARGTISGERIEV